MKLLVDEDLASRELIGRLEVALPRQLITPDPGSSDADVWERAQRERAAILTGNVVDFLKLAAERPGHRGLLLVYRHNDPHKDLRAAQIVAGIVAIDSRYPNGIDELVLAVNSFAGQ